MKRYKCLYKRNDSIRTVAEWARRCPKDWIEVKENLTFPRMMWVWDDNKQFKKQRQILAYVDGIPSPWIARYYRYANAEEIEELKVPDFPIINGYKGEYNETENTIKYGCVEFYINTLRSLRNMVKVAPNREIKSITLDSDVVIKMDEIKEILSIIEKHYK